MTASSPELTFNLKAVRIKAPTSDWLAVRHPPAEPDNPTPETRDPKPEMPRSPEFLEISFQPIRRFSTAARNKRLAAGVAEASEPAYLG